MIRCFSTFLIIATSLFWPKSAVACDCHEPGSGTYIQPSSSKLSVNNDPRICRLFEAAIKSAQDQKVSPNIFWRDYESFFSGSSVIQSGFGPKMYFNVDYDLDGIEEVFYFEYEDSSRRPGLISVYLYNSTADVEEDKRSGAANGAPYDPNRTGNLDLSRSQAQHLGTVAQFQLIRLFHLDGEIYAHTANGLFILKSGAEKTLLCKVGPT